MSPPKTGIQRCIAAAALLTVWLAPANAGVTCETLDEHVEVTVLDGVDIEDVIASLAVVAATVVDSLPPSYLLRIDDGTPVDTVIVLLEGEEGVAAVGPALLLQTPEAERAQVVAAVGGTSSDFHSQQSLSRIHAEDIQALSTGSGQLVAAIDTGVLFSHEVLAGRLAAGFDFVDDDADPSEERNHADDDGDGLVDEGAGHGTLVAGLLTAIAPDATILPLRVLDDEGRGLVFDVAKAVRFAVDAGAGAINLSLGLYCKSEALSSELAQAEAADVVVIAAAGNDDREAPVMYPAANGTTVSVTAVDQMDVKASFANYNDSVDVSAPGVELMGPFDDGAYAVGDGTSFAAPLVAGIAAVIQAYDGTLSAMEVRTAIRAGVTNVDANPGNMLYAQKLGTGRIHGEVLAAFMQGIVATPHAGSIPAQVVRAAPTPVGAGQPVWVQVEGRGIERVRIWDAAGRLVTELPIQAGGARWSGRDRFGRPAAAGVYFISLDGSPADTPPARVVLH